MTRRVSLIALVALAVLVGAWYGLALRPETKHITRLKGQQAQAEQQVSTLQLQLDSLDIQKKHIGAYRAAMTKLQEAVPEGPSLDQLINTVVKAAKGSHVDLTSLSTPEPSPWAGGAGAVTGAATTGPAALSVTASIKASDAGALAFVTTLEHEPRLYVITGLTLGSAPKKPATSAAAATGMTSYTFNVKAFYVSSTANNPLYPGITANP
jgi:hypothetical protein